MAVVYRLTRNNRIVSKRYALKHPDNVTSKESHPLPKKAAGKGKLQSKSARKSA